MDVFATNLPWYVKRVHLRRPDPAGVRGTAISACGMARYHIVDELVFFGAPNPCQNCFSWLSAMRERDKSSHKHFAGPNGRALCTPRIRQVHVLTDRTAFLSCASPCGNCLDGLRVLDRDAQPEPITMHYAPERNGIYRAVCRPGRPKESKATTVEAFLAALVRCKVCEDHVRRQINKTRRSGNDWIQGCLRDARKMTPSDFLHYLRTE